MTDPWDPPCPSCGFHPTRFTGPTAVETARARVLALEAEISDALRAYHEHDGGAAEGGRLLAEALGEVLPSEAVMALSRGPGADGPRSRLREAVERNDRRVAEWPESMRRAAAVAPVFVEGGADDPVERLHGAGVVSPRERLAETFERNRREVAETPGWLRPDPVDLSPWGEDALMACVKLWGATNDQVAAGIAAGLVRCWDGEGYGGVGHYVRTRAGDDVLAGLRTLGRWLRARGEVGSRVPACRAAMVLHEMEVPRGG